MKLDSSKYQVWYVCANTTTKAKLLVVFIEGAGMSVIFILSIFTVMSSRVGAILVEGIRLYVLHNVTVKVLVSYYCCCYLPLL